MGENTLSGRILKGIGGFYYVETSEGLVECKAKGIFRKRGISPLPGDFVSLQTDGASSVIAEISQRKNCLVRPPVANLDVLFVVAATCEPAPNFLVLDKMCAIAQDNGITPVLVITKTDLAPATPLLQAYAQSGIPVIETGQQSDGAQQLKQLIAGHISAFTGNSGVGKSTLLGKLLPDIRFETGDISKKLGRGRHTTRQVELYHAYGGLVADTPGFSSLDLERANRIAKENLQYAFAEFKPYISQCRFTGCSHRVEKGCAVRQAVEEGKIGRRRYESYLAMYEDVKDLKEWDR